MFTNLIHHGKLAKFQMRYHLPVILRFEADFQSMTVSGKDK